MFKQITAIFKCAPKTIIIPKAIDIRQDAVVTQEAEQLYHKAIKLIEQEQYETAIEILQQAIILKANYPAALLCLADLFTKLDRIEEAIDTYQLVIVLNPSNHEGYRSLAKIRQIQGDTKNALLLCQQAIALKDDVQSRLLLGSFLQYDDQLQESIAVFQQVIRMDEKNVDAYNNLGVAFAKNNDYENALICIQKAISLDIKPKDFHNNLAYVYIIRRKYELAIAALRHVLEQYPDSAMIKFNLALALLSLGHYKEGWEAYETRWAMPFNNKEYKHFANIQHLRLQPGNNVNGKTILVVTEQGLGDCLQFIRYIILLQSKGAAVVLICYKPLVSLFSQIPALKVVAMDENRYTSFDYFCHLLSLPYFFDTTVETIPSETPYLKAEPELVKKWQLRIVKDGQYDKFKVGLVWAGGARLGANSNDHFYVGRRRSVQLSQLAILGKTEGAVFYSLQKGDPQLQIKEKPPEFVVIDYMDEINDFVDTAAFIANLDLIITVDTSVAHLAGAMNKPTWILSRFDGCWRWLDGREDSPWYPSVRVFHQPQPEDWQSVIDKISIELNHLVRTQIPISFPQPILDPTEYFNLGNKFYQQNQYEQAENVLQTAVKLRANYPQALMKLGDALEKLNRMEAAIEAYQTAAILNPDFETLSRLGYLLQRNRKLEAALTIYQQAIILKEDVNVINNLAMALQHQGKIEEAIVYFKKSLTLDPKNPFMYSNLGMALGIQNKFDEMLELLKHAARLLPDSTEILNNLGGAYYLRREYKESLEVFQQVLKINPQSQQTIYNMSLSYLALGQYTLGWEKYETRWQVSPWVNEKSWHLNFMSMQLQPGQDITDKIIFLICEQGLGDSLQFIRYVFLMTNQAAKIILICPIELKRLFSQISDIKVVTELKIEEKPMFDYFCHLPRLPYIFGTTLETIPSNIPYFHAEDKLKMQWQHLLQIKNPSKNFRIGLVWAGNARKEIDNSNSYYTDCRRSMHLSQFISLSKIPNIVFYSLQKGEASQQIKEVANEITVIDYTNKIHDFTDTAALIANLDLIITVDTSVAHLAGAMNKPTWILSRFDGCWRWLDGRVDSPWYPSVRLFHQTRPGEWGSVIKQVALELDKLVRQR